MSNSKTDTKIQMKLHLTPRQRQCLHLTARGLTAKATALHLGISERMVRMHLEGARLRLTAGSTAQAIYLATKMGII
ncbi:MAG TPA: hypothetical protein G4N92_07995 [Anaerolineae bacterium]|nr:hypothetical protein [Anaerolineae bacterium]